MRGLVQVRSALMLILLMVRVSYLKSSPWGMLDGSLGQ